MAGMVTQTMGGGVIPTKKKQQGVVGPATGGVLPMALQPGVVGPGTPVGTVPSPTTESEGAAQYSGSQIRNKGNEPLPTQGVIGPGQGYSKAPGMSNNYSAQNIWQQTGLPQYPMGPGSSPGMGPYPAPSPYPYPGPAGTPVGTGGYYRVNPSLVNYGRR